MKKVCILLLVALLLVPACAFADANSSERQKPLLVDEEGLLTEAEQIALEEELERISTEQKCDIVIVIPKTLGSKTATEYADDFYDDNGYGYGETKDGILLLVCMEERDWATSTAGRAQDWFDDATLTRIENGFLPKLSDGDYLGAFVNFSTRCERVLQEADRREVLYLDDAAGVLSAAEQVAVTRALEGYSHVGYFCDVVVLTTSSLDGQSPEAYVDAIFGSGKYLHDASYDKVILLANFGTNTCYCITDGSAGDYITADMLAELNDDAAEKLASGQYTQAFMNFGVNAYNRIRAYFEAQGSYNGLNGGNTAKQEIVWFSLFRLGVAAVAGVIVALIVTGSLTAQMKSVRQKTEANTYLVKDSFRLTERQDLFLFANVTKTVRQTESSSSGGHSGGGGGSHFSSGGVSHGGHSGKF